MKSVFKIMCGLSIIGLATVACNKEIETEVIPEVPVATKHSVKVNAGFSSDTKTVMLDTGNQTKWTNDDITNMHFFENGIAPDASDLLVSLNTEKTALTIEAEFANTSASKYVYTSILASDLDSEKNATLDDEQYIFDGSFDPLADILVAKPEEFDGNQNNVEFTMQYRRVVAINKIKIKGLASSDTIESVTISSNKPILGSYNMTSDTWTNSGYELLLSAYDDIVVPTSGEVTLWFITAPVENATLSIYVVTDHHKYEKDFSKTISFAANTVTSFATTVEGKEVVTNVGTNDYIRVESTSEIEEGDYVLVTETTGNMLNGISTTSTKYGTYEAVTVSVVNGDHIIDADDVATENIIHIAAASDGSGNYVMQYGSDYLYWTTGNSLNITNSESGNSRWSIGVSSGNATIANVSDATRVILWNAATGQGRFAAYANKTPNDSGNQYHNVQLFKKDVGGTAKSALAKPVVSLERNATLDGIIVTWSDVNKAANYTVACTDQANQSIAQGVQTAEFTSLAPGTYTVTVTANPANTDRNTATTSEAESLEILNYQLPAPTLTFVPGEDNIVVNWTAVPNASSYTYTVLYGEAIVVAETNTTNLTFTASGLTENTTYTFKVKSIGEAPFNSSDYGVETQKTLKASIKTIAGIKSEITATSSSSANSFTATLTNAVVTSLSGNYAFIQDASGAMCLYKCAGELAVGNIINGAVSGKGYIYNQLKEITTFDVSEATITTGGTVTIPELTLAELVASYTSYEYTKVKLVGVHVSDAVNTSSSDANGSLTDGTNTLNLYVSGTDRNLPAGAVINIVGHPSFYSNAQQFASYNEGSNDVILYQIPTVTTSTSITGVPAAGVTNAEHDITIANDTGWTINVTRTGCVSSAALNDGHTKIVYSVSENTSETEPGAGTIVVTLSHENEDDVVKTIEVSQLKKAGSGGGDVHDDIVFNLDFSDADTYPAGFPTASGTTTGSYAFNGYDFGFKANTAFYYNSSGYLMIGKSGKTESTSSYITLPAPDGYVLTEISITASSNTSTNLKAYVGSDYSTKVTGDWQFTQGGTSNWTLSSTTAGVSYKVYLVGTGSSTYNGQITALHAKFVYDE